MGTGTVSLPTPPLEFEDATGRRLDIRRLEVKRGTARFDRLVEMYLDLAGRCRAMGIPPVGEAKIRDWLADLDDGIHLVVESGDETVGHATLLPDGTGSHELAIFVHQDYQQAGVGTQLLQTLLGTGREEGVERVWLTVSTGNAPGLRLFQSAGFSVTERASRQLDMELTL